jgi:replicative DNA helicase
VSDLQSVQDILADADARLTQGASAAARVWPTGFEPLDTYLGGGLRSGELTLLAGPQGLGKTTAALQILRHAAVIGRPAVMFSYEHDAATIVERLLAIEAGSRHGLDAVSLRRIREAMEATDGQTGALADRLDHTIGGKDAVAGLAEIAPRLHIHRSRGASTSVEAMRLVASDIAEQSGQSPLIVIDYLQKVADPEAPPIEEERVTRVVEDVKDMALDLNAPVLSIVAADREGLTAGRRLRVANLRGSSALAYEADAVLIMNDKFDVVARHHLVFDVGNAERFRNYVVITIEKNRTGLAHIDLEFRKRYEQGRIEQDGQPVAEQLVDERVFVE